MMDFILKHAPDLGEELVWREREARYTAKTQTNKQGSNAYREVCKQSVPGNHVVMDAYQ